MRAEDRNGVDVDRSTAHRLLGHAEVVYLDILHGLRSPVPPSRIGGRFPAHATAVGKAILALSRTLGAKVRSRWAGFRHDRAQSPVW